VALSSPDDCPADEICVFAPSLAIALVRAGASYAMMILFLTAKEEGHAPSKPNQEGPDPSAALMNPLIRKLSNYIDLPEADQRTLDGLYQTPTHVAAHTDLIRDGAAPDRVYLILTGWACRYKVLPDRKRQITDYFIPGDLTDQRIFVLTRIDHSIATMTAAAVVAIPAQTMIDLTGRYPRIAKALWWNTLVDEAITCEWVVNVGQRKALQRVAHLICEMFMRARAVGLSDGLSFDFPVTQADLADTVGLTLVHTNRMLQDLRAKGLIAWMRHRLTILDFDRLADLSMFNPQYLHLEHEGSRSTS
jgi:CRP-like cAMP-binding protein